MCLKLYHLLTLAIWIYFIDVNVVSEMTDTQLKEFGVVQFGDRIALRAFAAKEGEKKVHKTTSRKS